MSSVKATNLQIPTANVKWMQMIVKGARGSQFARFSQKKNLLCKWPSHFQTFFFYNISLQFFFPSTFPSLVNFAVTLFFFFSFKKYTYLSFYGFSPFFLSLRNIFNITKSRNIFQGKKRLKAFRMCRMRGCFGFLFHGRCTAITGYHC